MKGLALIVVVGVLGVLAVLAAAFVAMAQLERRASGQRMNAARAYLLARSGIEDALARLSLGQDAAYGGENWDGSADGLLSGYEAGQEVHHRTGAGTPADVETCPVRHALRPSFFVRAVGNPAVVAVDGRQRGYSGGLSRDHAYTLKAASANGLIHVNGGALDTEDRDPDGPGVPPSPLPLPPGAEAEVAPLKPNGIPDHRDVSMEGPNGFLVRLLNNLDSVLTNGASASLGAEIIGSRPVGGYRSLEDLPARARPYLTLAAWVDPKVIKPQPMDGRPHRWEDIDDAHRVGMPALEIAGVRVATGGTAFLEPLLLGKGAEDDPWTQHVIAVNAHEQVKRYPVRWERDFVYAWAQLRPAPLAMEPRAPVSIESAPAEVLAALFSGLRGTWLETWDGSAGWDGGFGFAVALSRYPYPSPATEETPWHRTRLDYGMTYGLSTLGKRPWYGPALYDPVVGTTGGKPVIQCAPLGRLKETTPVTRGQALATALDLRKHIAEAGPLRTWAGFGDWLEALPGWEDLDGDGILDGEPYDVGIDRIGVDTGEADVGDTHVNDTPINVDAGTPKYRRRIYMREDLDSDGMMDNEAFPDGTKGLTFPQKDVLRAMANPNTDLNDFNPDANLFKEVDKSDLTGLGGAPGGPLPAGPYQLHVPAPDAGSYAHTTELLLERSGIWRVAAAGRVLGPEGRLLAGRTLAGTFRLGVLHRDTTQADFLGAGHRFESPACPAPGLAGEQALVGYPEPPGEAASARDGQIGLGFLAAAPGPYERLRGDLFGTADAAQTGQQAVPDLRGPSKGALLTAAGQVLGGVFPDGVYSEKDRALKYALSGVLEKGDGALENALGWREGALLAGIPAGIDTWAQYSNHLYFYGGCWVKPHWLPEASPRAHALVSLSRGCEPGAWSGIVGGVTPVNPYDLIQGLAPMDDIVAHPVGLYFVPARNNFKQEAMGVYDHSARSTRGMGWPCRALLWGTTHSLYASDTVNLRGIHTREGDWKDGASDPLPARRRPLGRLEARRWAHVAAMGRVGNWLFADPGNSAMVLGRRRASPDGGGWTNGFGIWTSAIGPRHVDQSPNHLRFGEVAGIHNMNYMADATFANVRAGGTYRPQDSPHPFLAFEGFLTGPSGPAARGRYLKESGATYVSAPFPAGLHPLRITWTEVPCDLWFDEDGDGWLGDAATGYRPLNDRDGNGKRDVRIEISLEKNRYRAIFVNEWDPATRANHPLDVTPFLDDVTVLFAEPGGVRTLAWEADDAE